MANIPYTTRVRGSDGRTGTVGPDFMACCGPNESAVFYDGETAFEGADASRLTVLGPENAEPDMAKCGAGTEDCCIFLTMTDKPVCQRFTAMRWTLMFREMKATRHPAEAYPACMNCGAKAEP